MQKLLKYLFSIPWIFTYKQSRKVLYKILCLFPYSLRRALLAMLMNKNLKRVRNCRIKNADLCYSFRPFIQNQCIFVHIPKTAGVSVCKSIFGNLAGGHKTVQHYQLIFCKNDFDRYFKFTFVRNPWDRVFSAYHFLKKGGMNESDKKWSTENLSAYGDFDEFVKRWLNISNINQYIHFIPQYRFLCLPNERQLLVDFLGLFENIQDDFEFIKNKLSLDRNIVFSHENKTHSDNKKLNYRDFYTNETRDIISIVYEKDIKLLGYNFDNSSLKKQLIHRPS